MSQTGFIMDQIQRAYMGNAWHGPALFEILEDVDALKAARRAIPGAHTIWELTLHIAAWNGVIVRRLRGEVLTLEGEDNFPAVLDSSESAWQQAVHLLRQNHLTLLNEISALSDERLTETVPGKDYDVNFMLHGAVQHALYHAGQIAILKKARTESSH